MKHNPAAPITLSPQQKAVLLIWIAADKQVYDDPLYGTFSLWEQETCLVGFDRLWERYQGGGGSQLVALLGLANQTAGFFSHALRSDTLFKQFPWLFEFLWHDLFARYLRGSLEEMQDRGVLHVSELSLEERVAACFTHMQDVYQRSRPVELNDCLLYSDCWEDVPNTALPYLPARWALWQVLLNWTWARTHTGMYGRDYPDSSIESHVRNLLRDRCLPGSLVETNLYAYAEADVTRELLRLCPK